MEWRPGDPADAPPIRGSSVLLELDEKAVVARMCSDPDFFLQRTPGALNAADGQPDVTSGAADHEASQTGTVVVVEVVVVGAAVVVVGGVVVVEEVAGDAVDVGCVDGVSASSC